MRLINADALKKDLKSVTLSNGTLVNTNAVLYLLEEYPTAYDVDKVLEQLEEEKKRAFELCLATNDSTQRLKCIEKEQIIALAIEVVKGGGVDA